MNRVRVISQDEPAEGARQLKKAGRHRDLLINHQGRIYAVESQCPHVGGTLIKGKLAEEGLIVWPWHRSALGLETGGIRARSPWPPVVGQC